MTTPTPLPLNPDSVYSILLNGEWLDVEPGSLLLFPNPMFSMIDGSQPQAIGGMWLTWLDSAGTAYAAPVEYGLPVKWTPPPAMAELRARSHEHE